MQEALNNHKKAIKTLEKGSNRMSDNGSDRLNHIYPTVNV